MRVVWKGVQSAQGATFPINSPITKISLCVFALCPWLHTWLGGWGRVAFSSTDDELLSRSPALAVPPGPRPRGTALLQVCLQVCLQLELWWVRGCEPTTIQHSPNKSMSSATRVSHQGQTPEHWTIGPQTTRPHCNTCSLVCELCVEGGAQLTASRVNQLIACIIHLPQGSISSRVTILWCAWEARRVGWGCVHAGKVCVGECTRLGVACRGRKRDTSSAGGKRPSWQPPS